MILIATLLFVPFLCGIGLYAAAAKGKDVIKGAAAMTGACFILSLLALFLRPSADLLEGTSLPLSFASDGFHLTYALIAAFMWLFTTLFSAEYFAKEKEKQGRYWMFILFTLGATEGVMLSADFMTAFVFFEILSFTSFTWVIQEEKKEAVTAGYTYLFLALLGGMLLFFGLAILKYTAGTLRFSELPGALAGADPSLVLAAAVLIALGFGAKAGMFPLHIWLPMAHPVAPSPASALLSGILTKVGIYGILMTALYVAPDSLPFGFTLLALAMITLVTGAVMALFSVNLKRTLACSSMSQIGFILTGVAMSVILKQAGEEEAALLALAGVFLHMVGHSMIKLVLFLCAGTAVMGPGKLLLSGIRGFGRKKPVLKLAFLSGALGISGVPFFSGYLSKTLLHESIAEGAVLLGAQASRFLSACEIAFLAGGGLTFAYMLRLFFCLFVQKNPDEALQKEYDGPAYSLRPLSAFSLLLPALYMPLAGQPFFALKLAGFMAGKKIPSSFGKLFSFEALKGGAISLLFGGLVYVFLVRRLSDEKKEKPRSGLLSAAAQIFSLMLVSPLRFLALGMDAPVYLLSKILRRDLEREDRHSYVYVLFQKALTGRAQGPDPILRGFSFALMMTCIGILLILFVLVFTVL